MIKTLLHLFKKYLFALIGLFLVLYYIWFRFIRERLPRDIPFDSSWTVILILIIICISYFYIILRTCKPKKPNKYILYVLIKLQKIYRPFVLLDEMLRGNSLCCFFMNYFFLFFGSKIKKYNYYIFQKKNKNNFYLFMIIIPEIILLLTFCIEIFYFHKIKYFYYILWISFIPLMLRYILYTIKKHLENKIQYLDDNYYTKLKLKEGETDDEYYNYMILPRSIKRNICDFINTKYFIELQANSLALLCDLYNYDCVETPEARENYEIKYNIKLPPIYLAEPRNDAVSIALSKEYFKWMPIVINISAFFKEQELFKEEKKNKIDRITIIKVAMYLICWLYILLTTLYTLNSEIWLNILQVLKEILVNIEEPFSLIKIEEAINNYEQQYK